MRKSTKLQILVLIMIAFWAISSMANQRFSENGQWREIDLSDLTVEAGSPLDLSAWNDVPAGKHGRVIATKDGGLAFENEPESVIRFFGFNWIVGAGIDLVEDAEECERNIQRFACSVRRQGYNIIRTHCLDVFLMEKCQENGEFSRERLEIFDKIFYYLREQGIYIYLDLSMYGWGKDGWNGRKLSFRDKIFFDEDGTREIWEKSVVRLLAHVNPHTGLRYADDPAIVAVLFWNEQDLALLPPGMNSPDECYQKHFRAYLKRKYGTIDELKKSWNVSGINDFDEIKLAHSSKIPSGKLRGDASDFYYSLMTEISRFYVSVLKKTCYKGLYTLWDAAKNRRSTWARSTFPLVCGHDYFAHPSKWMSSGSRENPGSSLELWYFRTMAQMRIMGKPFMITEYGHGFWNMFGHEAGIAMSAYASLQDYSGLMAHCNAVLSYAPTPMSDFHQGKSPVFRANEFIAAHLYRRRDVAPSGTSLSIGIPDIRDNEDGKLEGATNAEQTKLALILGFGVNFHDSDSKSPVSAWKGSETVATSWTNTFENADNDPVKLDNVVQLLKEKALIPQNNRSCPSKGLFESCTGEIVLDSQHGGIQVITPCTEAIVLKDATPRELNNLKRVLSDIPAAVAVISIDGLPLTKSNHRVLCYATSVANTDMELSDDSTTMLQQGRLPLLVRTGKLSVQIKSTASFSCYALDINGRRMLEIPVFEIEDGICEFSVDTSELPKATVFFELIGKDNKGK